MWSLDCATLGESEEENVCRKANEFKGKWEKMGKKGIEIFE